MADVSNPRTFYAEDILTQTVSNAVWMQAADPTWASRVAAGDKTVKVPDLTTNVQVDYPADADALAVAPTIKLGSLSTVDIQRSIVRGYGGINELELRQSGGGRNADMQINEDIGVEMALGVDGKAREHVQGLAYQAVGTGNSNSITVGEAGKSYLPTAFPYNPVGDNETNTEAARKLAYEALRQGRLLMATKKLLIPQVRTLFGQPLGRLVAIMPVPVADQVVQFAADKGELQRPTDVAAQAIRYRGLFGMEAYRGMIEDTLVLADPEYPIPTGDNPWEINIFPSNSILQMDYSVIAISNRRFEDGTSGHRFVRDRAAIGLYGVQALRPEWFVRARIVSDTTA